MFCLSSIGSSQHWYIRVLLLAFLVRNECVQSINFAGLAYERGARGQIFLAHRIHTVRLVVTVEHVNDGEEDDERD